MERFPKNEVKKAKYRTVRIVYYLFKSKAGKINICIYICSFCFSYASLTLKHNKMVTGWGQGGRMKWMGTGGLVGEKGFSLSP